MAITPADIEQQTFSPSKHGYDAEEVDAFLEQISTEVDAMLQKIADLKGRLNSTEQQLAAAQQELAERSAYVPPTEAPVVETSSTGASERQIAQVLIVAQQSADKLVAEARDNADKIRKDADAKSRKIIQEALAEKQNELDEIDRLKQSREEFRKEYKELLQHFMDDAEAVFPNQDSLDSTPNGSSSVSSSSSYDVSTSVPPSSVTSRTVATPSVNMSDFGDLD